MNLKVMNTINIISVQVKYQNYCYSSVFGTLWPTSISSE